MWIDYLVYDSSNGSLYLKYLPLISLLNPLCARLANIVPGTEGSRSSLLDFRSVKRLSPSGVIFWPTVF